jgi:hypothetical protein
VIAVMWWIPSSLMAGLRIGACGVWGRVGIGCPP